MPAAAVHCVTGNHVYPVVMKQARAVLLASGRQQVYARVDGVVREEAGGVEVFVLMELELIEPYLYWSGSDTSYRDYAVAVTTYLDRHGLLVPGTACVLAVACVGRCRR